MFSGAAITKKKPHFLPKNGQKCLFWPETGLLGPEWSVVGPHTLFLGCWTQEEAFCKVLEQIIKGFRAAITKKNAFFGQKWPKKANFWPEAVFLGPEWSQVGSHTLC